VKLEGLDHPKTLDFAARCRYPNERFMDLTAHPVLPLQQRVKRLEQCDWQPIKARVHEESDWTCFYCGGDARQYAVCDHLTPIARGGTNDRCNLVTSCDPCNLSKGMLTLAEFNNMRGARD
jgi:5-methylcytosine-specific restriction endonuclease McrA